MPGGVRKDSGDVFVRPAAIVCRPRPLGDKCESDHRYTAYANRYPPGDVGRRVRIDLAAEQRLQLIDPALIGEAIRDAGAAATTIQRQHQRR